MYEVLKTFLSRKSNKIFREGETLPEDYYTKKEADEAIKEGLIKEVKPPARSATKKK